MRQLCSDLSHYETEGNPNPFGNGGFGTNYIAKDKRKQKKVVIKKIQSDLIKTDQEKNWLLREIHIESAFHHETILELSGYSFPFQNQGDYSIVTPFMPNSDLNNLIKQVTIGNIPDNWETIKSINIIGIAAGMAYLHKQNFIHQDLKPEHIVLDENNYPKIIVFHCSKLYKGEKKALPIETTIYMAPELLNDDDYTNKIDVFSYGMLIYCLLALHVPWSLQIPIDEINSTELYKLVSEGKRPELNNKEIPDCYKELIEKCWSNDPEKRPSFAQIIEMMIKNKDDFFDINIVDEEQLCQYIELVTEHL